MEWIATRNALAGHLEVDLDILNATRWNASVFTKPGRSQNISHFTEFQASVYIWRFVAPLILVVGTVGSILSLLVLCRKTLRVQTTMFYLSALAVADLMVLYCGLVRLWLEHAENIYIRLSSRAACKVHNFFVYLSLDLSVWILVAVSVDRCLYVSWPQLARKWCKIRNAQLMVVLIAALSAAVNLHFIWTYDLEAHDSQHIYANGNKKCYADTSSQLSVSFVENIWPWIDFCIYCLFPFLFMATSNAIIIKQLIRTEKNMSSYSHFYLDGDKRNSQEQRLDIHVNNSASTSTGQRSQIVPEAGVVKGKLKNHATEDSMSRQATAFRVTSNKCVHEVKDNNSSELNASHTLPRHACLGTNCECQHEDVTRGIPLAETSQRLFYTGDIMTQDLNISVSAGYQCVSTSQHRAEMGQEVNAELYEMRVAVSQEPPFDDSNGKTTHTNNKVGPVVHYSSLENKTPEANRLTENSLQFEFPSVVDHCKFQSQPIELTVFDELADIATPSSINARFHFDNIETKNRISDIRVPREGNRLSRFSERKKALTNKIHPLNQSYKTMASVGKVPETPITPEVCESSPPFWITNTSETDLLVNENSRESRTTKHKQSREGNIEYNNSVALKYNAEAFIETAPSHLSNIPTNVDTSSDCRKESVAEIKNSSSQETTEGTGNILGFIKKSLSSTKNKWQTASNNSDTIVCTTARRNISSVSKTLLAVTITFWVLNAPIVIFIISQTYITTSGDDRGRAMVILAWTVVNILQYMNNALHFFLYCLTGPKFRQELQGVFRECAGLMKKFKCQRRVL